MKTHVQASSNRRGIFSYLSCSLACLGIQKNPDGDAGESCKVSFASRDHLCLCGTLQAREICLNLFESHIFKGRFLRNGYSKLPAFSASSSDDFVSQVLPENAKALIFTMDELKKATSNFSPFCKVGQGGFGVVYKGTLTNGAEVAIKRARKDIFEARLTLQFQCEVNLLASIEHLNLVKLIGYFEGGDERILVQEYVPNGNLRQHLDCELGVVLDLSVRLDIAIDIAHALTYLHVYAERPIIHRDVKASNILLTRSFRAKVADFGFARVGSLDSDETHVSTQVKGTAGYLDPEYLKTYQLSFKSDVYSFGILLIEILTGRRPIEPRKPLQERITVRWAFKNFLNNNLDDILDPKLEKSEAAFLVARKMSELAFQCSAPTRLDRPSMQKVAEFLWAVRKEYQSMQEQKSLPEH